MAPRKNAEKISELQTYLSGLDAKDVTTTITQVCRANDELLDAMLERLHGKYGSVPQMYRDVLGKAVSKARPDRYGQLSATSETRIVDAARKLLKAGEKMMKNEQYPMALDLMLTIVTEVSILIDEMPVGRKLDNLIQSTLENIDIICTEAKAQKTAVVRRVLGAALTPEIQKTTLGGALVLNVLSGATKETKDELVEAVQSLSSLSPELRDRSVYEVLELAGEPGEADNYKQTHPATFGVALYQSAAREGRYEEAERIALAAIAQSNGSTAKKWRTDLYNLYKASGQKQKRADIAVDLLTEHKAIEYYDEVREALTEAGTWQKMRPAILQKIKDGAHPSSLAWFAQRHGEKELLLEAVQQQPRLISQFLNDLVPKYVSEVVKIVADEARYTAVRTRSGQEFARVAQHMVDLAWRGAKDEMLALVQQLLESCSASPSMENMLETIRARILAAASK